MDEHYIEFTAIIGPIDAPHKLHTFDANGAVHSTVHGDLADRLAAAVWGVEHDASASTHITTEAEMQARADAEAERDRLRAVVDAAHELLDEDRTSWSPEHQRLAEALAALDGSAAMGDTDAVTPDEMGNPDWYREP